MKNRLNRGFTLIELLVVIAIIGILSSVVLASLNTARSKGTDAAIKADITGIRPAAEIFYDNNSGVYGPVGPYYNATCSLAGQPSSVTDDSVVQKQIDDAVLKSGVDAICAGDSTWYVIAVPLKTDPANAWCIDSSGNSMQITTATFDTNLDTDCVIANT